MLETTIHYSRWVDFHYSPDDGGWYAADYSPEAKGTTNVYETVGELRKALEDGSAAWEK